MSRIQSDIPLRVLQNQQPYVGLAERRGRRLQQQAQEQSLEMNEFNLAEARRKQKLMEQMTADEKRIVEIVNQGLPEEETYRQISLIDRKEADAWRTAMFEFRKKEADLSKTQAETVGLQNKPLMDQAEMGLRTMQADTARQAEQRQQATAQQAASRPTKIHEFVDEAGQVNLVFQNPDGTRFVESHGTARPKADASGSDYARFENDFLEAEAAGRGKTVAQLTPPEKVAIKTAARKQYGQADDRIVVNAGGAQMSPTAESNIINRLTNQWTKAAAPSVELGRQKSLMEKGLTAARRGDLAAGSQAILVTFQKILDPTSVVRESEYDRSAAGQSLYNRISGAADQLARGGAGVPVAELEKFAKLATEFLDGYDNHLKAVKKRIEATADRYKIPRELVTDEINLGGGAAASPAASGMITVTLNGKKGEIPADQWEAFKKKNPTATR